MLFLHEACGRAHGLQCAENSAAGFSGDFGNTVTNIRKAECCVLCLSNLFQIPKKSTDCPHIFVTAALFQAGLSIQILPIFTEQFFKAGIHIGKRSI